MTITLDIDSIFTMLDEVANAKVAELLEAGDPQGASEVIRAQTSETGRIAITVASGHLMASAMLGDELAHGVLLAAFPGLEPEAQMIIAGLTTAFGTILDLHPELRQEILQGFAKMVKLEHELVEGYLKQRDAAVTSLAEETFAVPEIP